MRRLALPWGAIAAGFALSIATGNAQVMVDWLKVGGTEGGDIPTQGNDIPSRLVHGPEGQFWVCGMFGGPDTSSPEAVMFKLDRAGNEIARQPWRGAYAHAVAVATNGDYYLTGYVQDPGLLGVGQKYDFYLAKHAADGSLLWERTGGTLRTDGRTYQDDGQAGNAILLDSEGNVLVAGRSQGPSVYDTVALPNSLGGPLLCKYSPEGALLWIKRAEGSKQLVFGQWFGIGYATTLMLDGGGNVIIGGTMTAGTANFGGIVVTITNYGDYGPFTAKYTAAGQAVWVNTTGVAAVVDRQGNVYTDATTVSDLSKFDSQGRTVWKRTLKGVRLVPMALDGQDRPIYAGSFTGSVQLDEHQLRNDSLELPAGLVAKADVAGKFQWVINATGSNLWSQVFSVLRDPDGAIYACGEVSCSWYPAGVTDCGGTSVFGSLPLSIEHGGDSDFFLARISDPAPLAVQLKIARTVSTVTLSWPVVATNYVLEACSSLPSAPWDVVTNAPTVTATDYTVQLPLTGDAKFFRLRKQ